jgi:CheY-like chemotaxis protein
VRANVHDHDRRVAWVVDDSALESEMARRTLAATYDVEVFNDGSAVLENVSSHGPPDVLVLDWEMPGVSGIEVCRFLRSRPETSELGVLLLTVHQQTEQVVQGLAAGANDYLFVNAAAERILGEKDASLIGENIADIVPGLPLRRLITAEQQPARSDVQIGD